MAFQNSGYNNSRDNRKSSGSWKQKNGQRGPVNVFAPYNFVPFPKNPVYIKDENEIVAQNVLADKTEDGEELFSGDISYTLEAMTPVFVDDGTSDHRFCRNAEGRCVIPGSTMRGLIRSHASILGLGNVRDDIEDYSLMYRNVAGGLNKEKYETILGAYPVPIKENDKEYSLSILKEVRAGYIEKTREGKYVIYKTEIDREDEDEPAINSQLFRMNYYTLSERLIIENYLSDKEHYETNPEDFPYSFLIPDLQKRMMNKTEHFREEYDDDGKVCGYIGTPNDAYLPYYEPVDFLLTKQKIKTVTAVKPEGSLSSIEDSKTGVLVSTGYMQKKKVLYVVPAIDSSGVNGKPRIAQVLSESDVYAFQVDYNRRVNSLSLNKKNPYKSDKKKVKEYKDFFNLPEKEGRAGRKPVFYILLGGRCYFGFTPRLRLFYDYTVADGIGGEHVKGWIDYVKAIFGYTSSEKHPMKVMNQKAEEARKSRISFTDAVQIDSAKEMETRYLALLEPKPTDCLNYLDQSNGKVSYNSKSMQLRGAKQYWLHRDAAEGKRYVKPTDNMYSSVNPLDRGSCFKGIIRFKNLRKYELGLILWSLCLEKNSWMNIGKGKAFGYGAMRLAKINVHSIDYSKAYDLSGEPSALLQSAFGNPYKELKAEELINAYKIHIRKQNRNLDITQMPSIRDFFAMKDSSRIPDDEVLDYMSLKQYQKQNNKLTPLPTPLDVIKQHPGQNKPVENASGTSVSRTGETAGGSSQTQIKKMDQVLFLAGYSISDSQKQKLEEMSGLIVKQEMEWPNDENVVKYARDYGGIAFAPNAYKRYIESAKRHCEHVYKAEKTGKLDDGWTCLQ